MNDDRTKIQFDNMNQFFSCFEGAKVRTANSLIRHSIKVRDVQMDSATQPQSKPAKSAVRLGENGNKLAMACNDEEDQQF